MALALQILDDTTCSGCGQLMSESMDPDLAGYWSTWDPPHRCFACTALAAAQKRTENLDHPHTLRHIVGLSHGWEEHRSAARRERAAADQ